eukprot:Opistho-2@36700
MGRKGVKTRKNVKQEVFELSEGHDPHRIDPAGTGESSNVPPHVAFGAEAARTFHTLTVDEAIIALRSGAYAICRGNAAMPESVCARQRKCVRTSHNKTRSLVSFSRQSKRLSGSLTEYGLGRLTRITV